MDSLEYLSGQLIVLNLGIGLKCNQVGDEDVQWSHQVLFVEEHRQLGGVEIHRVKVVSQVKIKEYPAGHELLDGGIGLLDKRLIDDGGKRPPDERNHQRSQVGLDGIVDEHDVDVADIQLDVFDRHRKSNSCRRVKRNDAHIQRHVNFRKVQHSRRIDLPNRGLALYESGDAHIDIPTSYAEVVICERLKHTIRPPELQPVDTEVGEVGLDLDSSYRVRFVDRKGAIEFFDLFSDERTQVFAKLLVYHLDGEAHHGFWDDGLAQAHQQRHCNELKMLHKILKYEGMSQRMTVDDFASVANYYRHAKETCTQGAS